MAKAATTKKTAKKAAPKAAAKKAPAKTAKKTTPKATTKKAPAKKATATAVAKKRVKFEFAGQAGQNVYVAGSFNEWDPTTKQLKDKDKNGQFAISLLLPKEPVTYKFIVDGEWQADPANGEYVADGMGGVNSVLAL